MRTFEPLEPRTLFSVVVDPLPPLPAPGRPDLVATSDSGVSDSDNITQFNNATPDKALQFLVPGTTPGAVVTAYVNGVAAGSTVAVGPSTLVTLPAGASLRDGEFDIRVRQALLGQPETQSPESQSLSFVVDTTAPAPPPAPDLRASSDTGISDSDNLTSDATPTIEVDVAQGNQFLVFHNGDPAKGAYDGRAFTSDPLPDSSHTFTAARVDAAGNVSAQSAPLVVTIDTVAPPPGTFGGALDKSFGGQGWWWNPNTLWAEGKGVAVQADGKVVLGIQQNGPGNVNLRVVRVNPDGSLDASFGSGGAVELPQQDSEGLIAIQPGGNIVVAGNAHLSIFSRSGELVASGAVPFQPLDIDTASDGKIILVGSDTDSTGDKIGVMRYNPDGTPDVTFGTNGKTLTPNGPSGGSGRPTSVVAAPGGKVLVAATSFPGSATAAYVLRYNDDGSLDPTFDADGYVRKSVNTYTSGQSVLLQPNGDIVLSGTASPNTNEDTQGFVSRFHSDGTPDTTFGQSGTTVVNGLVGRMQLVRLSNGDLLVSRRYQGRTGLARFDSGGAFDPTFGGGAGPIAIDVPTGGMFQGMAVALGPDDKVLMAGISYEDPNQGNYYPAVLRFNGRTEGVPDLVASSDTGTDSTDNITNDNTPTFNVTGDPGKDRSYFRLYRNDTLVSGRYQTPGEFTTGVQPDGTFNYSAEWVDAAGNESEPNPGLPVTIDTAAPRVEAASAASASWPAALLDYLNGQGLGADSYDIPGGDAQLAPLPWTNLNRLQLRLSEPVTITRTDMRMTGVNFVRSGNALNYVDSSGTATWTLSGNLPADKFLVTLSDAVKDVAGNALAEPFRYRLNALPGDANQDGLVNALDLASIKRRLNRSLASPGSGNSGYSLFADINGDGKIGSADLAAVRAALGSRLPAAEPAAPGAPSAAPAPAVFGATTIKAADDDNPGAIAALLA